MNTIWKASWASSVMLLLIAIGGMFLLLHTPLYRQYDEWVVRSRVEAIGTILAECHQKNDCSLPADIAMPYSGYEFTISRDDGHFDVSAIPTDAAYGTNAYYTNETRHVWYRYKQAPQRLPALVHNPVIGFQLE